MKKRILFIIQGLLIAIGLVSCTSESPAYEEPLREAGVGKYHVSLTEALSKADAMFAQFKSYSN